MAPPYFQKQNIDSRGAWHFFPKVSFFTIKNQLLSVIYTLIFDEII